MNDTPRPRARVSMNYWLLKTEPGNYSWADLVKERKACWDGVRNYQARNNLRKMTLGDLCLMYHSVSERSVVGVARVVGEAYPDPTAKDGDWSAVDLEPVAPVERPVDLATIKATQALGKMVLVNNTRLSVQPVTKAQFDRVLKLAATTLPS